MEPPPTPFAEGSTTRLSGYISTPMSLHSTPGGGSGRSRSVFVEPDAACRVFVGNLTFEVDWRALREHMSASGRVVYAAVMKHRATNKSKGCGVVQYASRELRDRALREMAATELMGRPIFMRPYQPAGGGGAPSVRTKREREQEAAAAAGPSAAGGGGNAVEYDPAAPGYQEAAPGYHASDQYDPAAPGSSNWQAAGRQTEQHAEHTPSGVAWQPPTASATAIPPHRGQQARPGRAARRSRSGSADRDASSSWRAHDWTDALADEIFQEEREERMAVEERERSIERHRSSWPANTNGGGHYGRLRNQQLRTEVV